MYYIYHQCFCPQFVWRWCRKCLAAVFTDCALLGVANSDKMVCKKQRFVPAKSGWRNSVPITKILNILISDVSKSLSWKTQKSRLSPRNADPGTFNSGRFEISGFALPYPIYSLCSQQLCEKWKIHSKSDGLNRSAFVRFMHKSCSACPKYINSELD